MASVNKVILIGNLGADPDKRFTGSGATVTTFNIATTERWNDKQGQKQEDTQWHRIVVWGKQAENCAQYLSKGRPCYIEGRLQTREWEKDGVKRYTTEVVVDMGGTMQLLGGRGGSSDDAPRQSQPRPQRESQPQQQSRPQSQPQPAQQPAPDYDSFDDDIPF